MSEGVQLYASMATVTGPQEDFQSVVVMAGESLLPWIRQFDGYKGFVVLADGESGTAHFMTFWENREALERSARSRQEVREQLARTAGARIAAAGAYTVVLTDGVATDGATET